MSGHCPDCGNTMCLCDEVTRATYPLRMEILELRAELEKERGRKPAIGNPGRGGMSKIIERLDEFTQRQGIVSGEWCRLLHDLERELTVLRSELGQKTLSEVVEMKPANKSQLNDTGH